jgi:hypothetical protein
MFVISKELTLILQKCAIYLHYYDGKMFPAIHIKTKILLEQYSFLGLPQRSTDVGVCVQW